MRFSRKPDVEKVTNPPILPFVPYLLSFLRKQKYLCLIHDVYPDIAVRLGYLRKNGVLYGLWERMNQRMMHGAAAGMTTVSWKGRPVIISVDCA